MPETYETRTEKANAALALMRASTNAGSEKKKALAGERATRQRAAKHHGRARWAIRAGTAGSVTAGTLGPGVAT